MALNVSPLCGPGLEAFINMELWSFKKINDAKHYKHLVSSKPHKLLETGGALACPARSESMFPFQCMGKVKERALPPSSAGNLASIHCFACGEAFPNQRSILQLSVTGSGQ